MVSSFEPLEVLIPALLCSVTEDIAWGAFSGIIYTANKAMALVGNKYMPDRSNLTKIPDLAAHDDEESVGAKANRLLVVSTDEERHTILVLRQLFNMNEDGCVLLKNIYFSITLPVCVISSERFPQLLDQSDSDIGPIDSYAAVLIICSADYPQSIVRGKEKWERIAEDVEEETVCVFYVGGHKLNETETHALVQWSVRSRIELVTEYLCEEEDNNVSDRLNEALGCASWKGLSANRGRPLDDPSPFLLDSAEATQSSIEHLESTNSIRRGLCEKDISMLIDTLLLHDDDDSDDT